MEYYENVNIFTNKATILCPLADKNLGAMIDLVVSANRIMTRCVITRADCNDISPSGILLEAKIHLLMTWLS